MLNGMAHNGRDGWFQFRSNSFWLTSLDQYRIETWKKTPADNLIGMQAEAVKSKPPCG